MHLLKVSTAATVLVGPVMDSTGAAVTSGPVIADFTLTKNGTAAALASTATATHSHNGHWLIALTTGNTDTAGRAVVTVNNASYAMPPARFSVLPATVFDALVTNAAGGSNGLLLSDASNRVDVGKWLGVVPDPLDATAVALDGGTVDASPTPSTTTFSSSSTTLHAPSGGYSVAPMGVLFTSGVNRDVKLYLVRGSAGHVRTGSVHAFTFLDAFPTAPAPGDTFVIG